MGDWHDALKARFPERVVRKSRSLPYSITVFHGLPAELDQPALSDDVLCLHRGGAKRVHRLRDGVRTIHDVELHALTLLPRHRSAKWWTEGPYDHTHVTLSPKAFDELALSEFGKPRSQIALKDDVGFSNPVLCSLAMEMERVADDHGESQLYVDALFTAFSLALLRHCSDAGGAATVVGDAGLHAGGLAGWRLRQIVDYMRTNRAREIELDELTSLSGLSRAHFFRAFRKSTGTSPGRYLEQLRIEDARRCIDDGELLAVAAERAGFTSVAAMSRAFRRATNMTPGQYRRWYR